MSPTAAADELDALFAAPEVITVRGEPIQVRGVQLEELPQVLRLHARQDESSDGAAALDAEMMVLIARLCGRPVEWFAYLDQEEAEKVFDTVQTANSALAQRGPSVPVGTQGGASVSWATAVARLVEYGHRLEDIRHYTLAQIDRLLQAHARNSTDARLDDLSIARAAQADRKGFQAMVDALQRARASLD